MAGHGRFHWNELMSWDVAKAKTFYAATLGWSFADMPMPNGDTYTVAMAGEQPAGGIMALDKTRHAGQPERWFGYIEVDDIDACLQRAEAAGAEIVQPAFDVAGVGRIGIVHDTNGAGIGFITPAERQG